MSYLTSLNFLQVGSVFPPVSQHVRLDTYLKNRMLYEGEHLSVFKEQFKRIDRVISNFSEVINYAVIINYPKKISFKTADLICGEKPRYTLSGDDERLKKSLKKIDQNNELQCLAYEVALDMSRYGDGLLYIKKDSSGKGKITTARPEFWFPVVSPEDIKEILYHVYAYPSEVEGTSNLFGINSNGTKYLNVQIHERGKVSTMKLLMECGISGDVIKSVVEPLKTYSTGLTDFAIINVSNVTSSDKVTGDDDYSDLDSILSEIEVRISQIVKILDKHAEPSVSGPSGAITTNPITGEKELFMGNYFVRDRDDPAIEYITWEAQLQANFQMLDKLMESFYAISEISPILFNDIKHFKQDAPSGTALKRLIAPTISKINRLKMKLNPAMIRAIKLVSQYGGKDILDLSDSEINILWRDGLPADPMEDAQVMSVRTAGKQTMSVKTALQTFDEMSEEVAEDELNEISEETTEAQDSRQVGMADLKETPKDIMTPPDNRTLKDKEDVNN